MLCISYGGLQELYEKITQGEKMGKMISEQLFLEAIADITSFYVDTPEQRYLKFLARYPNLNQWIPQYLIAYNYCHLATCPVEFFRGFWIVLLVFIVQLVFDIDLYQIIAYYLADLVIM